MTGEEEVEDDDGGDDPEEEFLERESEVGFENKIDRDAKQASKAVVHGPDREQEVAGFAFVGIAAARASTEGGEPIPQRLQFVPWDKNRTSAAHRTAQAQGPPEILQCFHRLSLSRKVSCPRSSIAAEENIAFIRL